MSRPIQTTELIEFARKSLSDCNLNALRRDLTNLGYFTKGNGRPYRVRKKKALGLDKLFIEQVVNETSGEIEIRVTTTGKKLLKKLFKDGQLTRKAKATKRR